MANEEINPEELADKIAKISVKGLNETIKFLEEKHGIIIQAPVAAAASGVAQVEEKSSFNITLTEVGAKKIEVIKAVRDITAKGLKEAKDLVDAAASSPQMVKENAKKEEAEEIKKKFEAAGAKVELK